MMLNVLGLKCVKSNIIKILHKNKIEKLLSICRLFNVHLNGHKTQIILTFE